MKRESYLRDLSSEHHQALGLARQITRDHDNIVDPQPLVNRVIAVYTDELVPHFAFEEQVVLPELLRLGETDLVERTLGEHRQLHDLITQLDETDALSRFAAMLAAHVRFEERILFPACQTVFDQAAIASIRKKRLEIPAGNSDSL